MTKEDLKDLKWRENNGDFSELLTSEIVKVRMLKKYITYLKVKGNYTSEARELRHNNSALEDWEDFIRGTTSTIILESTRDTTSNTPLGLSVSSRSCSHQLTPIESFKRSIKWDSI